MKHARGMADPFRAHIRNERLRAALWLLLLLVPLAALVFAYNRASGAGGELIEAEVVRVGSRATETGDEPVITVRLADGSIRQVLARPNAVVGCKQSDSISLVQRGVSLRVGVRGCHHYDQT